MWKLQTFGARMAALMSQVGGAVSEPRETDGADRDFVTVEDGEFEYASSASGAVSRFEYAGQAECIIDRSGRNYPLLADGYGGLVLGRSQGNADLTWLRNTWRHAQREQPRIYPLIRRMPESDAGFLGALFEMLQATAGATGAASWTVQSGVAKTFLPTLADVSALLLKQEDLSDVVVEDPFGQRYRPARTGHGKSALSGRRYLLYRQPPPG